MQIPLAQCYFDPETNREMGDVNDLADSLLALGQLQAILVEDDGNGRYLIRIGRRRFLALQALVGRAILDPSVKFQASKVGLTLGFVEAVQRDGIDPLTAKLIEFDENEKRKEFEWKERVKRVKEIHDAKTANDPEWSVDKTAALMRLSRKQIYLYLGIVEDTEVFNSTQVQMASTLSVAAKQVAIQKEITKRKRIQAHEAASVAAQPTVERVDFRELSRKSVFHGDSRDWIRDIPDEVLSWFHWDPPFGGREGGGGAFVNQEKLEMDPAACMTLMQDMRDEIWRVLKPGAWLAFWYTPAMYQWVRNLWQGHHFVLYDGDGCGAEYSCKYCDVDFGCPEHLYSNICPDNPRRMWVNPYPNYWLKTNRSADGHEIKRFLTKQTECFLLACKSDDPILIVNQHSNVFSYDMPSKDERRSVAHKPAPLLADVLSLISVSGELGGDAGASSGSIIEAAFGTGRRVVVAEISDYYAGICCDVAEGCLRKSSIRDAVSLAPWL